MSLKSVFQRKYNQKLFTTPSHGGDFFIFHKFRQFYKYDISETDTHLPEIELQNSQARAALIYGTQKTIYLTNGSTSGVIAAVIACTKANDHVLLWRNAHISHHNAIILSNTIPIYYDTEINPELGVTKVVSPEVIEAELKKDNKIKSVIITSPSYEGFISDTKKISNICKKYECRLIVDEAHGALYPFSDKLPQTAIKYADIIIQSLHKTAGGLNPTALLHSNCADIDIEQAVKLITTTSPSYPLLTSIEANINFLNSQRGKKKIEMLIKDIQDLKTECPNVEFYGDDITKLLIKVKTADGNYLSGKELSEKLFSKGIEDERANDKTVMLLCGIGTGKEKFNRLKKVLRYIE